MKFTSSKHGKKLIRKIKNHGFTLRVERSRIIATEEQNREFGATLAYNNPLNMLKTLRQHWPI